jgi:hypothetical protein
VEWNPRIAINEIHEIPLTKLRGIVIQKNPLGDVVLAITTFLWLLRAELSDFQVVQWGGGPEGHTPSKERMREWKEAGYYLIGVADRHYHDPTPGAPRGGSRTYLVLRDFGIIEAAGVGAVFKASHEWLLDTDKGRELVKHGEIRVQRNGSQVTVDALEELVDKCTEPEFRPLLVVAMAANRNNATGNLKNDGKYAAFWVVRELAKQGYDTMNVVGLIGTVFSTFFRMATDPMGRDLADMAKELALAEYFAKGEPTYLMGKTGAFTIGELLQNMWQLGDSVEDIDRWADFWLEEIEEFAEAERKTQKEARTCTKQEFVDGKAVQVHSDNPRLARHLMKVLPRKVRVIMVVGSGGNVAILTRGRDGLTMDKVGAELQRQEPHLWSYDHRLSAGAVLNGSHSYVDVPPTTVKLAEIRRLISQHAFADVDASHGGGQGGQGERRGWGKSGRRSGGQGGRGR